MDSDEPLMLPLEAIELDAFRHRHEKDTFWCGHLLGGCGGQLTTKLYTDRVCHFAHHPDPTGQPRICDRRARGVSSADHLYMKSAAAAWVADRGQKAAFHYPQPDGAPIGSVLDIVWDHGNGALRVHLDATVPPAWDNDAVDVVVGMSVPVDTDTLVRRWYVHRVRFENAGTAREIRIGTEAFARDTEWFALDECEMTERGLSTPAVEQILRSRSTRPVSPWAVGRSKKVPDARARAQMLLRKLAEARKVGSVVVVTRVCRDIAAISGAGGELQAQMAVAISDVEHWLEEQAEARRELFSHLERAVAEGNTLEAGRLLMRANAIASDDRTEAEGAVADSAAGCLVAYTWQRQAAVAATRAEQEEIRARQEADRVRTLLETLERRGAGQTRKTMRKLVKDLVRAAAGAGTHVDAQQQKQIDVWKRRADIGRLMTQVTRRAPAPTERTPRPKRKPPLHEQVARRFWIKEKCPVCHVGKGRDCINDDQVGSATVRQVPHDERLQPIVEERKVKAQQRKQNPPPPRRPGQVYDVTCPDCDEEPGARCATPGGPHRSRVERARKLARRYPGPE
ncbi:hypothetical protein [Streptomyces chattanoogensis]|uniref:hypothetical protein n=1 Tax=Streptomyces chattanoogensis TaxID=66876 RepID=UPI0036B35800